MAQRLGRPDETARRRSLADDLAARINHRLWDEDQGIYVDLARDGGPRPLKSAAAFAALFAGVADSARAARLIELLRDPKEFGRPLPIPSVAASEPTYSDDMWRGPTWVNYNYLIVRGLLRYGHRDMALDITRRTLDEIAHWYGKEGVIFEYYDAEGKRSPRRLARKGRVGGGWIHTVIPDYHWTAALYLALAHCVDRATSDRS
jgi:neutral trehalase